MAGLSGNLMFGFKGFIELDGFVDIIGFEGSDLFFVGVHIIRLAVQAE
ncbi:hypothetical protein RN333_07055 [Enterobacter kobei]|jgi:hypothetical protein|nr:hypothetical protein [Enterobacter kobei]WNP35961.1 hypothetical protein RN333_07055 [Enterobacter kobei]